MEFSLLSRKFFLLSCTKYFYLRGCAVWLHAFKTQDIQTSSLFTRKKSKLNYKSLFQLCFVHCLRIRQTSKYHSPQAWQLSPRPGKYHPKTLPYPEQNQAPDPSCIRGRHWERRDEIWCSVDSPLCSPPSLYLKHTKRRIHRSVKGTGDSSISAECHTCSLDFINFWVYHITRI